jgi:hypothetical protein
LTKNPYQRPELGPQFGPTSKFCSADVEAAVEDMEALYAGCGAAGRLAGSEFDFMKAHLTVDDTAAIGTKLTTQPYTPPPMAVTNASVFPA